MVSEGSAVQAIGNTEAHVVSQRSARIEATGDLQTADGSQASVRTADGLQVELRSQTRVGLGGLRASKSQVNLLGGAIRCTVPHRTAAHAFQVVTADATVVDLGTVFTVSIEGPNHATRVSVEEGEVLVRFCSGPSARASSGLVVERCCGGAGSADGCCRAGARGKCARSRGAGCHYDFEIRAFRRQAVVGRDARSRSAAIAPRARGRAPRPLQRGDFRLVAVAAEVSAFAVGSQTRGAALTRVEASPQQ